MKKVYLSLTIHSKFYIKGVNNVSLNTIEKATMQDAKELTAIMKKTFDEEAAKWLPNEDVIDYNIQPPGYSSLEVTKYMIEELDYYKIMYRDEIAGGIIITFTGKNYGRIDRIFVNPVNQGKGIGSKVIGLIEQEFSQVRAWDLETSTNKQSSFL
jgi:GNAT superfamily N-acetyltransferase